MKKDQVALNVWMVVVYLNTHVDLEYKLFPVILICIYLEGFFEFYFL